MPYQCVPQQEHINGAVCKVHGKFEVKAIPPIDQHQLLVMRHLAQSEAEMVTRFLNRLKDARSLRAIHWRMNGAGDRGLSQLLGVQAPLSKYVDLPHPPDYLKLSVKGGEIRWAKESLLESFERRIATPLYYVKPMQGWRDGRPYDLCGRYMVAPISRSHILDPVQPKGITNLSAMEADRFADFLNRLCSIQSLRAIGVRMAQGRGGGLERLILPPKRKPSIVSSDAVPLPDYLKLTIIHGQIGWAEGSVLEQFEAEYQQPQQKELFAA